MLNVNVLLFKINGASYGADIAKISSIIRSEKAITRAPGANCGVRGVVRLRGGTAPLVDMRARFSAAAGGKPRARFNVGTRVVVLKSEGATVGLIVDSIGEIAQIGEIDSGLGHGVGMALQPDDIDGIARVGDKVVRVLNADRFLQSLI
ncbi:MAG: chemotaxis protein CheW [Clostridiales bacterium]|nr:chemotaxis protein CheW [Clostridiales bacterium]